MGKEEEKEKKKKDKKEKEKKDKKKKEKDKKEKKEKYKYEFVPGQEWKLQISKQLDDISLAYEKISNRFKDIDNYILRDAKSLEDFKEKVRDNVKDLSEESQRIFLAFLDVLK